MDTDLPKDVTPPHDSDSWKPYSSGILRRLWDIRIVQSNTTKEKWGDTQFRNSTSIEMRCNGKLVYSFGTGGNYLEYAFAKVQYLQVQMGEHPFDFFNPEKEHGRKIYFYGLPSTVRVWRKAEPWLIGIDPDYTGTTKELWWKEYRRRKTNIGAAPDDWDEIEKTEDAEDEKRDWINWGDALSDQHINWFRK